jgi:hypothetical protein
MKSNVVLALLALLLLSAAALGNARPRLGERSRRPQTIP